MLRFVIFLSLSLMYLTANAQETKKVTSRNSLQQTKETYYVLKSNSQIKQGDYEKLIAGRTAVKGQFENNQKSGIWVFYGWDGRQVVQKYDFTNNRLLYDQSLENAEFDSSRFTRPALYLGGYNMMMRESAFSIQYPPEAIRLGIQGTVSIKALISEDGKMTNEEVVEGIGYGCDQEALRVLKLVPDSWIPALDLRGNPVASEVTIPMQFRVQ
ncbi:energy transducer TonB [Cesiribacter sp. SM1]|uniref:energy transducer TonB n=1 Tax=Cesiribacter sp. SM1 TaxID=2861196 RepID=UPI001CD7E231|nr:energy transducer TonB [Cesiribacter sp. SM1]